MSGNNKLEDIKRRIRAFLNMTIENGASEAEANMAMRKAGELMAQYNLSMTELDVQNESMIQEEVGIGTKKYAQTNLYVTSLAKFCQVKVWYMSRGMDQVYYTFYGLEPDVKMAAYLLQVCRNAMKTETEKFKRTVEYVQADMHRKSLSTSFQNGMGHRLYERFVELIREAKKAAPAGSGTALVVISKEKRIAVEFAKLGTKLRKSTGYTRTSHTGASLAGRSAANNVNLNRPITGSGGTTKTIGGY